MKVENTQYNPIQLSLSLMKKGFPNGFVASWINKLQPNMD